MLPIKLKIRHRHTCQSVCTRGQVYIHTHSPGSLSSSHPNLRPCPNNLRIYTLRTSDGPRIAGRIKISADRNRGSGPRTTTTRCRGPSQFRPVRCQKLIRNRSLRNVNVTKSNNQTRRLATNTITSAHAHGEGSKKCAFGMKCFVSALGINSSV